MQTADHPAISSPREQTSWRPSARYGWRSLFAGRHGLLSVAVLAMALAAFAVGQNWVAFTTLLPLLYVVPCAAMMYVCMRKH